MTLGELNFRRPGSPASPGTLKRRLVTLTLAVLVPAFLIAALLLWSVEVNARRALYARLQETARALSLVVDRQFGEQTVLLETLAASFEMQRGDWTALDQHAREVLRGQDRWISVVDSSGRHLVNTRLSAGEPLPRTSFSDQTWAGELKPGVRVSNLLRGQAVAIPIVVVGKSVTLADGRSVRISVVTPAKDFQRVFRDQQVSPRWTASLLDSTQALVARSRDSDALVGRRASPDMRKAIAAAPMGIVKTQTLDGIKTMSAFSQLPNSRWTIVVGVPRSEFAVGASQPVVVGTVLALVLLSFGVLLAILEATKIQRPVRQLALAARAWREGAEFEPDVRRAPLEIAELIGAFDGALGLLRSREDALAEAQARLSLALRAAGAGTWDWDLRTGVANWSPEFFDLMRVPPQPPGTDLRAMWDSLVHPEDRADVAARAEALHHALEPFTADMRVLLGPERELCWIRSHAVPVAGPDGKVARVVGVNVDVTALRAHEAALERANRVLSQEVDARTRELDQIWRLSRDPFLVADSAGCWLRVSPAWTDLLGWTEAELVGRTSEWMEHPQDRRRTRKQDERLARGEVVTGFENRFRARDGSYRWFAWMAVPFEGFNYCVARDVTAEKEAASELQRAQEALRQSQKMDAIGQLTGGVAHDFNNLLTPIVGSLDMLKRRAALDERDARLLEGAAQSAERARVLVQRLLAFARRQPLQPRPLDVGELVASMSELVGSTLGPRIRISFDVAPGLPKVRGDQNQLEMALLNLAVNARDAMPDGGGLTLAARQIEVEEAAPDLSAGRYVCLSVTDTGAGMDARTLTRAIEPFFSTKGIGKGTGLGLSMAHGLVAQLGGALRISSQLGVGTTVEIWLPESRVEAAQAAADYEATSSPAGEGVVLLVDDDAEVRLTTSAMLADLGYSVVEASGGREALRLLDGGLRPDVVVTDHLMPGLTGAELIQAIRNRGLGMAALIVSGYADVERLPPDLPRMSKPFLQRELGLKLRSVQGLGASAPQTDRA